MAFAFKPAPSLPAKPTFGLYTNQLNAGEYILYKKARATFCNSNSCPAKPVMNSQGSKLLLQNAKYIDCYCSKLPFDLTKLNINLITALDLNGCCVIQTNPVLPTKPSCEVEIPIPNILNPPFYANYIIDPYGSLFGLTQCGNNNFLRRLVYQPPSFKEINYNNTLNINPYS
jgi:hypothetical protein